MNEPLIIAEDLDSIKPSRLKWRNKYYRSSSERPPRRKSQSRRPTIAAERRLQAAQAHLAEVIGQ